MGSDLRYTGDALMKSYQPEGPTNVTIWQLSKHQKACISGFESDLNAAVIARLQEMGIAEQQEVCCLRKTPISGPIVISLGGSALALEKSVAESIHIKPIN